MIGRNRETQELLRLYNDSKAELVAVYGRRRVGKTYLVDEALKGKITFHHAGLSPAELNGKSLMKSQLEHFYYSLLMQGMKKTHRPGSWLEAFFMLETFLQEQDDGTRQVVFLDELPWMDTPRSGFITAFEGFWNNWGCHRNNLMVIVCGSATSWIQENLINNHGGLYNRVTYEIKLEPFTLSECEEYFKDNQIALSRYDIVQSYMMVGGIPYYLGYFEKGKSLAQNIDTLFFGKQAKLSAEFERLFSSVFSNASEAKVLVELLSKRNAGYTRAEISEQLGVTSGGTLTKNLNALIASDFIIKYQPFGCEKKETRYKLVDPFCLFYLHFVGDSSMSDPLFWQNNQSLPSVVSWRGFAFENVCFQHIEQIKATLGISGVQTECSAWSKRADDKDGTQIDLLLKRNDNVVNCCEIKFYNKEFTVNKSYYRTLLNRQDILREELSPKQAIHNTLITTFGLKYNEYSGIFSNVITLDDLFR